MSHLRRHNEKYQKKKIRGRRKGAEIKSNFFIVSLSVFPSAPERGVKEPCLSWTGWCWLWCRECGGNLSRSSRSQANNNSHIQHTRETWSSRKERKKLFHPKLLFFFRLRPGPTRLSWFFSAAPNKIKAKREAATTKEPSAVVVAAMNEGICECLELFFS